MTTTEFESPEYRAALTESIIDAVSADLRAMLTGPNGDEWRAGWMAGTHWFNFSRATADHPAGVTVRAAADVSGGVTFQLPPPDRSSVVKTVIRDDSGTIVAIREDPVP